MATFEKATFDSPCMVLAQMALSRVIARKCCVSCGATLVLRVKHGKTDVWCDRCQRPWTQKDEAVLFFRVESIDETSGVGGRQTYHRVRVGGAFGPAGPWMRSGERAMVAYLRHYLDQDIDPLGEAPGCFRHERMHCADQTVPRDYYRATWAPRVGVPTHAGPWMHTPARARRACLRELEGPHLWPLVGEVERLGEAAL